MASVIGICGGLVGPRSENVEKALVSLLFFERSRGPRGRQDREQRSGNGPFRGRKSEIVDVKCVVSIFRSVIPT